MNVQFHADAVIGTSALRVHAEELRRSLLQKFDRHIQDIRVSVTDHTTRYGSKAFRCQAEVTLNSHISIITRHADSDPKQAVNIALSKAAKTVARRLQKRRSDNCIKPDLATT